jgi:hypothetical protein
VWIKDRSTAYHHWLTDSVRGTNKQLSSSQTIAETSYATLITALNSNGFSLSTDSAVNNNSDAYAAWCWDAGSSTVTNTQGSISSQVRANASAGFSIVSWVANNTAGATVGHGLGVAPSMVIVKNRNNAYNWSVYHASLPSASYVLTLNSTSAQVISTEQFNGVAPSSTVITLGANGNTNYNSGNNIIAYCFAPVNSYSAFGSYTGNGSADGPFVYTGFRPRWILYKNSSQASDWAVYDAARSSYNVVNDYLTPNTSAAEGVDYTNGNFDILSNGFKIRATWIGQNGSSNTIIYAAFAESPFQYARAR